MPKNSFPCRKAGQVADKWWWSEDQGADGDSQSSKEPWPSYHPSTKGDDKEWVDKTKTLHEAGTLTSHKRATWYNNSKESHKREEGVLAVPPPFRPPPLLPPPSTHTPSPPPTHTPLLSVLLRLPSFPTHTTTTKFPLLLPSRPPSRFPKTKGKKGGKKKT